MGEGKKKRETSRMRTSVMWLVTWIACVLLVPMLSSDMAPHAVRKVLLFS